MQGFHMRGVSEDVMRKVGVKKGNCWEPMEQNMSFNKSDAQRKMREVVAIVEAYGKPKYFVTVTPNFQGFPGLTDIMRDIGEDQHKVPSALVYIH